MTLIQNIEHAEFVHEKTTQSRRRLAWADHARGFAIILVVYRHVAVGLRRAGMPVSNWAYNLQEVFFDFRMPVFFVLSGIFTANSLSKRTRGMVLRDKVSTLLYPYLLWAILMVTLELIFSKYINAKRDAYDYVYILTQPRAIDHLWYLLALFNTTIIYLGLSRIISKSWIHALIALGLHSLSMLPLIKTSTLITDAFFFYPYYFIGTQISSALLDPIKSEKFLNPKNLLWLTPFFLVGQWFWFTNRGKEDEYFLLFLAINLIACYLTYTVFYQIAKHDKLRWLERLGTYSLYIYILHVPIAAVLRVVCTKLLHIDNLPVIFLICWLGGLFIPIWMFDGLKKYGFKKLFSLKPAGIK